MNKPLHFGTNEIPIKIAVVIPIIRAVRLLSEFIQFLLKARVISILKNMPIIKLKLF